MFKFELGEVVVIAASNEKAQVIGRAEYNNCANSYQLRYSNAHGVAVEQWWAEDALKRD